MTGIDDSGSTMAATYDASAGTATFDSKPKEVYYKYKTGHKDVEMKVVKMDVTLAEGKNKDGFSPTSGCGVLAGGDSCFGALAMLTALSLLLRKDKK